MAVLRADASTCARRAVAIVDRRHVRATMRMHPWLPDELEVAGAGALDAAAERITWAALRRFGPEPASGGESATEWQRAWVTRSDASWAVIDRAAARAASAIAELREAVRELESHAASGAIGHVDELGNVVLGRVSIEDAGVLGQLRGVLMQAQTLDAARAHANQRPKRRLKSTGLWLRVFWDFTAFLVEPGIDEDDRFTVGDVAQLLRCATTDWDPAPFDSVPGGHGLEERIKTELARARERAAVSRSA